MRRKYFEIIIISVIFANCTSYKFVNKFENFYYSKTNLEQEMSILKCRMSKNLIHAPDYFKFVRRYDSLASRINFVILKLNVQSSRGFLSRNKHNISKNYSPLFVDYVRSLDSLSNSIRKLSDKGGINAFSPTEVATVVLDAFDKGNTVINNNRQRVFDYLYLKQTNAIPSTCKFD